MYIDSTNETEPSGELPVAKLLQTNIEPLLKVRPCKVHHDFVFFSGFSVGCCINIEKVICYQLEFGK